MATVLAPPSVGQPDLAAIREAKGLSLSQISSATKIAPYYLEAIERSRFDRLPGGVFNTSYIRQYARAIDYDECDLLACYSLKTGQNQAPEPPRRGLWKLLPERVVRMLAPARP